MTVAGTCGSQYQVNAPTIQDEIEHAIAKLTGEKIRLHAASRTDTGVHARGQVVSLRTEASFPPETWIKALNFYLPPDIAVMDAYIIDNNFDVRRNAVSREYRYSIWNNPTRSPLRQGLAYFIPQPLDIGAMNQAAQVLPGEHDFAPFCSATVDRTCRHIYKAEFHKKGNLVIFDIVANSFLPHQVRNTVGGLIQVGLGKIRIEDFWKLARSGKGGTIGPAAPANGLCLMKVNYAGFPLSHNIKEKVESGQRKFGC